MAKIIVYVRGGNVQDIISNCEGHEVMIVDYDNEKCSHGKTRLFESVRHDPNHFNLTIKCAEGSSV